MGKGTHGTTAGRQPPSVHISNLNARCPMVNALAARTTARNDVKIEMGLHFGIFRVWALFCGALWMFG